MSIKTTLKIKFVELVRENGYIIIFTDYGEFEIQKDCTAEILNEMDQIDDFKIIGQDVYGDPIEETNLRFPDYDDITNDEIKGYAIKNRNEWRQV